MLPSMGQRGRLPDLMLDGGPSSMQKRRRSLPRSNGTFKDVECYSITLELLPGPPPGLQLDP